MHAFQIIADSSCDIPIPLQKGKNIHIVPFSVTFDTLHYYKELTELMPDAFYEKMQETGTFPKTSLPSIADYTDAFEPYLKEEKDVLCICLSSKFSGSYQSAVNAKRVLEESYPQREIEIIDSISATGAQGLLVLEAARLRDKNVSLKEAVSILDSVKKTSKINFTVDSLEHLQKGGRIGKAAALAGTILNIKPIIVLHNGELHPESKVRGSKKARQTLIDMTEKEIGDQKDDYRIVLVRAEKEREEIARAMAGDMIAAGFHVEDIIWTVGVTIGTHTGATAIGICYIKKFEKIERNFVQ